MIRVVLDANVIISAVISSRGSLARVLSAWEEERINLVFSEAILEELGRVMRYPHLQQRYDLPEELVGRFLVLLRHSTFMVEPTETLNAIAADPSDIRYLDTAIAGDAAYVVSGDRHLLDLKVYRGIQIVNPREFLALLQYVDQGPGQP